MHLTYISAINTSQDVEKVHIIYINSINMYRYLNFNRRGNYKGV